MIGQLNQQFISVVHGSLGSVSQTVREKVETVLRFLGAGSISFLYLPALFAVLRETPSRVNFVATLLAMRDREDIRCYREWCRKVDDAWHQQDINQVCQSVEELKQVSNELATSLAGRPLRGTISHVPDVKLLASWASAAQEQELLRSCFNPSLAFAKDIGSCLALIRENRKMVEDLLSYKLTSADVNTLEELQAKREHLYSPGEIDSAKALVSIGTLEVTMGDTMIRR
jgi:hypothetical protein